MPIERACSRRMFRPADEKKIQNYLEIKLYCYTDGYHALQGFVVDPFEFILDGSQVDFRPAHDDADQSVVVGSGTDHCVVQTSGEISGSTLDAFDCQKKKL